MCEQPYKWMTINENSLRISVKVVPNSSKNSITDEDEFLKIKITAPPVDNKANKALTDYLAKLLKVPKSLIVLKNGETSKNKIFELPISCYDNLTALI